MTISHRLDDWRNKDKSNHNAATFRALTREVKIGQTSMTYFGILCPFGKNPLSHWYTGPLIPVDQNLMTSVRWLTESNASRKSGKLGSRSVVATCGAELHVNCRLLNINDMMKCLLLVNICPEICDTSPQQDDASAAQKETLRIVTATNANLLE